MRKHLYFNSSNLDYTSEIINDDGFEATYEYAKHELEKTHPNEYGRIKTNKHYIHFFMGTIKQEGCPWCGSECKLITNPCSYGLTSLYRYFVECQNCFSRGPILNINYEILYNEKQKKHTMDLIWHKFNHRRMWDADLDKYFKD